MNKKVKLFGVEFDALNMKETVNLVELNIQEKIGIHLLGVNADKINEIDNDDRLKKIVLESDIINADGASVILASKILKKPLPERVAGIDLMEELLKLANAKNYSVYFLGAKEEVVNSMVSKLMIKYPNLDVRGYRNGYFSEHEWSNIAKDIDQLQPDIVFIGITSPMKEYLIDYFLNNKMTSVFMGVGGSFDVLSGEISRAPIWLQKLNLEWLYRVSQEPKRLFKRYFFGNIKFIFKIFNEMKEV